MVDATSTAFVSVLRRYQLLEPAQLEQIEQLATQFPEPKTLARELLQRGWLTAYQINQIGKNQAAELRLGNYVLLERLGEGGMGAVFKARHDKMGRVVALKVIRKERLDSLDAVQRFQREVHAAAQLNHANIVQAYDADEANGTHFLAMEYVEGTDLNRLVKEKGPLPVDLACDVIRQAACGLAHAHEQGLVHRDIKPANLIVDGKGVVKILDMGIARMTGDNVGTLTQEGAIVGSLDYIAPEQALNSHQVDIRADLYSLGCTFYFLLSGQAPFPGGEAAEKLLKHQQKEPVPLEHLRPEVPSGVTAIVRKLMAKRPDDRYQTPAAVAEALTNCDQGGSPDATLSTHERWARVVDPANTIGHDVPRRQAQRRFLLGAGAGGTVLVLALGLFAYLFRRDVRPPSPSPLPEDPPAAKVTVPVAANQLWQDTGIIIPAGQTVTLVPQGHWSKKRWPISAAGQDKAPRDRAVVAEAPLMCLLVRIGEEAPVAVLHPAELTAGLGGRLFVQANDLDLADNSGTLKLAIDGGLSAEDKIPAPPLLPIQLAEQAIEPLLAKAKDPAVKPEQLRDEIIDFCLKYRSLPQTYRAGALLPELPRLVNSIGMKLAPIAPGKYVIGSPENELGREPDGREGPQHEVVITRPFYLGVYPVTVGQFRAFVKATGYKTGAETSGGAYVYGKGGIANDPKANWQNPGFEQTDEHPVVCVNWNDAQKFCDWLSKKEGQKYALPTEAQWEYSCRAGSRARFFSGDADRDVGDYAWYSVNSGLKTHPVGQKKPNAWGLYDMNGNVRQWCQDYYDKDYYKSSPSKDPEGPSAVDVRVVRGGSWTSIVTYCRSASRPRNAPWYRDASIGFRVVLLPAPLGRVRP